MDLAKLRLPYLVIFYSLLLAGTAIGTHRYTFQPQLHPSTASAQNYELAKELLLGLDPLQAPKMPTEKLFPGYPALLSGYMRAFGSELGTVKLFNGLCWSLVVPFFFFILLRITKLPELSFAIALVLALHAPLAFFSSLLSSEIPFLLISLMTIGAIIRAQEQQRRRWGWVVVAIVGGAGTLYVGGLGLALVIAGGVHFLTHRLFREAVVFPLACLGLYAPWWLSNGVLMTDGRPSQQLFTSKANPLELSPVNLGKWVEGVGEGLSQLISRDLPHVLLGRVTPWHGEAWGWGLGILFLVGMGFSLVKTSRYRWLLGSYLLISFTSLVLWPWGAYSRQLLLPLVPFMLYYWLVGVWQLLGRFWPGIRPEWALILISWAAFELPGLVATAQYPAPLLGKEYFQEDTSPLGADVGAPVE
ncbi:MAG TPA: hypothetical protein DCE41_22950 [Cytophagales bacterium]|nr:hypothetical protein [Cytophagales bacterium]HAA24252.1 hypothetical protein [Cytophagales bacterium]HAP60815.1 hypothetical protein [Cytophagales bacterium]